MIILHQYRTYALKSYVRTVEDAFSYRPSDRFTQPPDSAYVGDSDGIWDQPYDVPHCPPVEGPRGRTGSHLRDTQLSHWGVGGGTHRIVLVVIGSLAWKDRLGRFRFIATGAY